MVPGSICRNKISVYFFFLLLFMLPENMFLFINFIKLFKKPPQTKKVVKDFKVFRHFHRIDILSR